MDMQIDDVDDLYEEATDLWVDRAPVNLHGVDVDDSSIFYTHFPTLPDFSCISSSSSSSSSAPASVDPHANYPACPSSPSFPRPFLRTTDSMEIPPSFDPQIGVNCINFMQELGDMDLPFPEDGQQQEPQREGPQDEGSSEDLGMVFLEWLKSNKESISAEDLRAIKLKKCTIECAAQRLGGGKEGMTQLLKLILDWVQNHHLHKRHIQSGVVVDGSPNPNPNRNSTPISPDSHLCFSPLTPWIPHQLPSYADPAAIAGFPPMTYMGDPALANGGAPFSPLDCPMIDTTATWPPLYNSYRYQHLNPALPPLPPPVVVGSGSCGNQYSCYTQMIEGHGDGFLTIDSSATKEARMKRMARQRRFPSHHRSHNQLHDHQHQNSSTPERHVRLDGDANCTTVSHHQRQFTSKRRPGWKQEKKLRGFCCRKC